MCGLIKRSDLKLIWMRKPADERIGKVRAHWRHYSRAAKAGRKHMFGTVNSPRSAAHITMLISIFSAVGSSGGFALPFLTQKNSCPAGCLIKSNFTQSWGVRVRGDAKRSVGGGRESLWPCGMEGVGAGLWNQEIICLVNTLNYLLCLPLAPSKWSETFTDLSFHSERADGEPGSLSTTHLSASWTA